MLYVGSCAIQCVTSWIPSDIVSKRQIPCVLCSDPTDEKKKKKKENVPVGVAATRQSSPMVHMKMHPIKMTSWRENREMRIYAFGHFFEQWSASQMENQRSARIQILHLPFHNLYISQHHSSVACDAIRILQCTQYSMYRNATKKVEYKNRFFAHTHTHSYIFCAVSLGISFTIIAIIIMNR